MSNENRAISANSNVLTFAITVVVLAVVLLIFWDRQQQRSVELRRIENRVDLLEDWGIPPQMQPNLQPGQQMPAASNLNMQPQTQPQAQAQVNGGRIF